MTIELKIPHVGETIQEVQISQWLKHEGDCVAADEDLVVLETDKATMELPAPAEGVIRQILKQAGETASVGETIAYLDEADGAPAKQPSKADQTEKQPTKPKPREKESSTGITSAAMPPEQQRRRSPNKSPESAPADRPAEREVKYEVEQAPRTDGAQQHEEPAQRRVSATTEVRLEEVVPMSSIRRRIAERLVAAQQTAALLTTFNEIDMSAVVQLREKYGEKFRERYGVKLGFMSFFVKSAIEALKAFPAVNAEVRGTDIVYRNYFHIGVAVSTDYGLVVPVLRYAERMSFAEVEQAIGQFAVAARDGKLKPDDLAGGTFTITNGGVFGSLLSTPIVNPPQSGILGMHAIQDRPVAHDGQVVIRPMMYVAVTYDHRIVDGREAVGFLRRIKDMIEEPSRMLIET